MTSEEYRRVYLTSEHWKNTRLLALKRARYKCEGCMQSVPLDVHHLSYKNLWHEQPDDLMCLCRECHDYAHEPWGRVITILPVTHIRVLTIRWCARRVGRKIKNKNYNRLPMASRKLFQKARRA